MHYFRSPYSSLVILLVLGIGTVAILFSITRQQSLRSDAASTAICAAVPQQDLTNPPSGGTNAITADTKILQSQYDSLTSFSVADKKALALKIRETATNRKKKMLQAIQRNPDLALPLLLSDKDRAEIASVTTNCIEKPVTVEGLLSIVHYDFNDAKDNEVYTLTTGDKKTYRVYPAKDGAKLQNSMRVKLDAYQLDEHLIVDTSDTDAITVVTPGTTLDIPSSQGDQETLVILANFSNTTQPSITQTSANNAVFTEVDNYIRESSYNKTAVLGTTRNWVTATIPQSCDVNAVTGPLLTTAQDVVSDYDRFIIFAPFGASCQWNGAGTIGKAGLITINGQQVSISVSWINTSMYNGSQDWLTRVIAHEFSHNLGIHHAVMPTCNCQLPEYGDPFTVMGKNQYGGGETVVQLNAPHREYIGWMSDGSIQTVTTNGTHTLLPLESTTQGLKALKIPRGNGDFLYVEYRQPIGVDDNIANIAGADAYEGALLHTILHFSQPITIKSSLIDTTPTSPVPASVLHQGTSYTDPASGATLQVTNKTATGLTINVSFDGEQPTSTPTPTDIDTPSPTPTRTPTPNNSPTPTVPTPTPTDVVDPCTGVTNCVRVEVSLLLHGIGGGGDNTNPNATGNPDPLRTTRLVMVEAYDEDEQLISDEAGIVTFDASSGEFRGTIGLGELPTNRQYILKVWSNNYLTRRIPGIRTLSNTQVTTLPTVSLITGDINNNNILDILDYNALLLCYSGITFAQDCSSISQFEEADLTDDGSVDRDDYTLFLRELLTREGD